MNQEKTIPVGVVFFHALATKGLTLYNKTSLSRRRPILSGAAGENMEQSVETKAKPAPGKKRISIPPEYLFTLAAMVLAMAVVWAFTGHWPTSENPYRSYTLQALAWLDGRLELDMNYTWLELAVYEGKYYVSFPPFPSFVMLPFAAIFGPNTPDHLVSLFFTLVGVIYALKLYRALSGDLDGAEKYVLFLFLANGYLFISIQGWVWYLAQVMCFCLSLMALYYAVRGRGGLSLAFWACAVGCRPMVVIYLPLLAVLIIRQWKKQENPLGALGLIKKRWYWAIAPTVIAAVYMGLNYARFGNPLEFGHNYLPEFQLAEHGQFSFHYLLPNLINICRLPTLNSKGGALQFAGFDCMAFWLIAPMTISFLAAFMYAVVYKGRKHLFDLIALPLMLLTHLLIICCHRTMGGYQFGNRYMVDMLPYVFYGLLLFHPREKGFHLLTTMLMTLGFALNLVGTIAVYNHWI